MRQRSDSFVGDIFSLMIIGTYGVFNKKWPSMWSNTGFICSLMAFSEALNIHGAINADTKCGIRISAEDPTIQQEQGRRRSIDYCKSREVQVKSSKRLWRVPVGGCDKMCVHVDPPGLHGKVEMILFTECNFWSLGSGNLG